MSNSSVAHEETKPEGAAKLWSGIVTDTLAVTVVTAVLYFWGMIYYAVLADGLGFGVSLFALPIPTVIMAPWDSALMTALWLVVFWTAWKARPVWLVILYHAALALAKAARWACSPLITLARRLGVADWLERRLASLGSYLSRNTPRQMSDEIDRCDERRVFASLVYLMAIGIVVIGAQRAITQAQARVEAYKMKQGDAIVVKCKNATEFSGCYITSIGDAVVVRLPGESPDLILLKMADIAHIKRTPASWAPLAAAGKPKA